MLLFLKSEIQRLYLGTRSGRVRKFVMFLLDWWWQRLFNMLGRLGIHAPRAAARLAIVIVGQLILCQSYAMFSEIYSQDKSQDEDSIKIETSLVWVPVSVKTRKGMSVAGLTRDRFKIFEDGSEQQIDHFETPGAPITVALVIDMSDSAKLSLGEMRLAANAFIDKLTPKDKALIVAFDKNIHRVIGATGDREMLRLGLLGIEAGGGTALYDTVDHIISTSFQGVSGRKAVILLTDGIDTSSLKSSFEKSADQVAAGNVPFFPIQYQPEAISRLRVAPENNQGGALTLITTPSGESIASAHQRGTRFLRLLADSSGGRFQLADSTANLQSAFARISVELRQQYYLGFYPDKTAQKLKKRKLKITVNVPEARIDARDGYISKP